MTDDHWHQPLVHVRGGELSADTTQTAGMTRLEAISGKNAGSLKVWMGQTHVAPAAVPAITTMVRQRPRAGGTAR